VPGERAWMTWDRRALTWASDRCLAARNPRLRDAGTIALTGACWASVPHMWYYVMEPPIACAACRASGDEWSPPTPPHDLWRGVSLGRAPCQGALAGRDPERADYLF